MKQNGENTMHEVFCQHRTWTFAHGCL